MENNINRGKDSIMKRQVPESHYKELARTLISSASLKEETPLVWAPSRSDPAKNSQRVGSAVQTPASFESDQLILKNPSENKARVWRRDAKIRVCSNHFDVQMNRWLLVFGRWLVSDARGVNPNGRPLRRRRRRELLFQGRHAEAEGVDMWKG